MFSTLFEFLSRFLSRFSRRRFPGLLAGGILAVLAPLAAAQTLVGVQTLMKEGKMSRALEQVDRYIAAQPKDAQGPFTKGLILTGLGRTQEAIAVFTGLTENFPELPEPYNNLAVLYAGQKQYDKARVALEMAIRTHPSYAIAHENLGDIYAKLASQAYDKALQLDSSNRAAQIKLSMIGELINPPDPPGGRPAAMARAERAPVKTAMAEPPAPATPVPAEPAAVPPPRPPSQAVAAKPAAGEPPAAAGKSQAAAGKAEDEIGRIVRDWAAAWSRKDVKAYLAFYADDFQTPNGVALGKWKEERRQRIDKPGKLQVSVNDVRVSLSESGDRATARFRQQYVSATLRSQTSKTLVFVRSGNGWLIAQERVS
ncbi:MAG: tetratricopeptide repeat protein [Candidatus Accumulibacter sp.]|jgi:tetratricopeptide (TPR) repeat protein|nr:tetratricopeptide repeat protein [Accumulibacter sp.]